MSESTKKKELIQKTYEILQEEGLQGIKIRRVTSEIGCSSTVLYKHFADIDHLVMFASVRFLQDYIRDFKNLLNDNRDPLELNLRLWDCFAEYAFRFIPIFEMMFYGKYKENLGDTIFEFYRLFPEDMKDFDGLSISVLFSNDLQERDYMMLRRAAGAKLITLESARLLSRLDCYIFHGMLMEHMNDYRKPGVAEAAAKEFSAMLHEVTNKYRIK